MSLHFELRNENGDRKISTLQACFADLPRMVDNFLRKYGKESPISVGLYFRKMYRNKNNPFKDHHNDEILIEIFNEVGLNQFLYNPIEEQIEDEVLWIDGKWDARYVVSIFSFLRQFCEVPGMMDLYLYFRDRGATVQQALALSRSIRYSWSFTCDLSIERNRLNEHTAFSPYAFHPEVFKNIFYGDWINNPKSVGLIEELSYDGRNQMVEGYDFLSMPDYIKEWVDKTLKHLQNENDPFKYLIGLLNDKS